MNKPDRISIPAHPGTEVSRNTFIPMVVLGGIAAVGAGALIGSHNSAPTISPKDTEVYSSTASALKSLPPEAFTSQGNRISIAKLDPSQKYGGTDANKDEFIDGQPFHVKVNNRDGKHGTYYLYPIATYAVPKNTVSAASIQLGSPNTTSLTVTTEMFKDDSQHYVGDVKIVIPSGEEADIYGLVTTPESASSAQ